jgi:hypothetical protein
MMLKVIIVFLSSTVHSGMVLADHDSIVSIYLEPSISKFLPIRIYTV